MIFNDKWTKEVNDEYRQMIKNNKSDYEIRQHFGDLINYHPKKKFSIKYPILTYEKFIVGTNEIKINPKHIDFKIEYIESKRYRHMNDIYCYFEINNTEYILILEYLVENNSHFNNQVVYNIFFTTKEQFDTYNIKINNLNTTNIEEIYSELQDIVEKNTNKNDTYKIINAISYIVLNMSNKIKDCIYMISETDDIRKFNYYKQTIEESFNNYKLTIDVSIFMPDRKSYYYIIGK